MCIRKEEKEDAYFKIVPGAVFVRGMLARVCITPNRKEMQA